MARTQTRKRGQKRAPAKASKRKPQRAARPAKAERRQLSAAEQRQVTDLLALWDWLNARHRAFQMRTAQLRRVVPNDEFAVAAAREQFPDAFTEAEANGRGADLQHEIRALVRAAAEAQLQESEADHSRFLTSLLPYVGRSVPPWKLWQSGWGWAPAPDGVTRLDEGHPLASELNPSLERIGAAALTWHQAKGSGAFSDDGLMLDPRAVREFARRDATAKVGDWIRKGHTDDELGPATDALRVLYELHHVLDRVPEALARECLIDAAESDKVEGVRTGYKDKVAEKKPSGTGPRKAAELAVTLAMSLLSERLRAQ